MRRWVVLTVALASLFLFSQNAVAVDFPMPSGFVNDFAGVLTPPVRAEFEQLLQSYEAETSNEVVVAIVTSFERMDPFSYSQELFTLWKPGQKSRNNGILMVIGPSGDLPFPERGEVFINVGKGLEGAVPDGLTGSIIRQEMVPEFKARNFAEGVRKGLQAVMRAAQGEYEAITDDSSASFSGRGITNLGIFLIFVFFNYAASFLARSKSWWLGGVLGGVGGSVFGMVFFASFLFVLVFALGFGGIGLVLDYILSKNYEARRKAGRPTDFWHSGGGFWLGGGGSGGGGGFGGFGGGMSGGGGAGGRW